MKTIEPFYQINLDFTGFRVGFRIYSHQDPVTELYTYLHHCFCLLMQQSNSISMF